MTPLLQPQRSSERSLVMWRVTVHCWVHHGHASYATQEIVDVEAPENDLQAATKAGVLRLRATRGRPQHSSVTRIDVKRLEGRTPPSSVAQQEGLWDEAIEPGEAQA